MLFYATFLITPLTTEPLKARGAATSKKSNKATKAYFLKLKRIEIKNEISNDKMQTYITLKKTSQLKI